MFTAAETTACRRLLDLALEEDLGANGDLTSQAVIPPELPGRAALVGAGRRRRRRTAGRRNDLLHHRSAIVVSRRRSPTARPWRQAPRWPWSSGRMRSILAGERTALNFLQRLSGVATTTAALRPGRRPGCRVRCWTRAKRRRAGGCWRSTRCAAAAATTTAWASATAFSSRTITSPRSAAAGGRCRGGAAGAGEVRLALPAGNRGGRPRRSWTRPWRPGRTSCCWTTWSRT